MLVYPYDTFFGNGSLYLHLCVFECTRKSEDDKICMICWTLPQLSIRLGLQQARSKCIVGLVARLTGHGAHIYTICVLGY
jgi:hypothetical protein